MSRRNTVITVCVAVVVALILGGVFGAIVFGGDAGSDTPAAAATESPETAPTGTALPTKNTATDPATNPTGEPAETVTPPTVPEVLPTPATGSLTEGRKKVLLGGKLTIPNTPVAWVEKSSDGDSANFADESNCSEGCPQIWFYDTTKGQNHVTFGDNPLAAWAKDVCHGQGTDLSAAFTAGGKPATYRTLSCQGQDFHAWWVPSQKVLVTTQDADGYISDPKIVQAALEGAVWKS